MKTLPLSVKLFLAFGFLFATQQVFSQTNTFPTTGAAGIGTITPNASALLDVSSTTKGVLIPRMTKAQRDAIAAPATGLFIFQTNNTPGLYYYDGSAWTAVTPKAGANKTLNNLTVPTAVNTDLLPATTNASNLGSSTLNWKNIYAAGSYYIGADKVIDVSDLSNTFLGATGNTTNSGSINTFTGRGAGGSNTTGFSNTASGYAALYSNLTGYQNTAYGAYALYSNASGTQNTANGYGALYANTGSSNTASGYYALFSNTTGIQNTASGSNTLAINTIGNYNTANGYGALYSNTTGTQNTANGNSALLYNSSGNYNSASGFQALYSNTTGSANISCGNNALYTNTTGHSNVAIGTGAIYYSLDRSNLVAVGDSALFNNYLGATAAFHAINNTAIGSKALYSNTTGSYNTAIGFQTLYSNTTGDYNTASGLQALYSNTTGEYNTASGLQALYSNTTGFYNTANGYQALYSNTTGIYNTANGYQALYSNTTGSYNTANGYQALYSNTTGVNNTANGYQALYSNTTGIYNTAIGNYTLDLNTTGYYNTAVGYDAKAGPTAVNVTVIGNIAYVDANNKVRIGNTSVSSNGGQVSWSAYSDGRIKNEVKENVPGLTFINELRPVTFHYDVKKANELLGVKDTSNWAGKYDIEKMQFTGFIAQEVEAASEKVNYDFSGVDKSGNILGLRYSDFVVPLVKAVQELSSQDEGLKTEDGRQNSELENLSKSFQTLSLNKDVQMRQLADIQLENEKLKIENGDQQKQLDELKSKLNLLQSAIANPQSAMTSGFAKLQTSNIKPETILGQNIPNPFDNSTLIPFRIPKDCNDASIMITNTSTSQVISVIPISCNEDHLRIDAGTLASGVYSYTLYVDGIVVGTRQMVIQK